MKERLRLAAIFMVLPLLAAAAALDDATIVNSGSTNTAGFSIAMHSDATIRVTERDAITSGSVPKELSERFFADLRAARADMTPPRHCMKSASFGTRTTVTWQGWRSPDLQCPPASPSYAALANDVREIEAAAGITSVHRIGIPPGLRKIPPSTPEVQAT